MTSNASLIGNFPTVTGWGNVNASPDAQEWEIKMVIALEKLVLALGILLCLASVIVFILEALRHGYPRVRKLGFAYAQSWGFVERRRTAALNPRRARRPSPSG
jgi:hypothetical protein